MCQKHFRQLAKSYSDTNCSFPPRICRKFYAISFGLCPKLKVESVSKSKAYFETLSYKLEVIFTKQKPAMDGCVHKQQRDLCIAQISSFKSVQGCTLLNTGTGCQSIYNICILNDCKLTFEFFKNVIFEKRRQFLNRPVS